MEWKPTDLIARGARTLPAAGQAVGGWIVASPARVAIVVVLLASLLVAMTTSLAARFHAEEHERSEQAFARGRELLAEDRLDDAVRHLRAAVLLARGRHEYTLALAAALIEAGRPGEAETYLTDVLREAPTSGFANLLRARAARALGDVAAAETHYQRALYGEWSAADRGRRIEIRFELAGMLRDLDQREGLLAQLSELYGERPEDPAVRRQLAEGFLDAGAPEQAAELLRGLVEADARNAELWSALARAEYARNDMAAARRAGARAIALGADDDDTASRLKAAERILALNPTAPRLSNRERSRRLRAIVTQVDEALGACAAAERDPRTGDVRKAIARSLAVRRDTEEQFEARLFLLEGAWAIHHVHCPADADPALAWLVAHLSTPEEAQP